MMERQGMVSRCRARKGHESMISSSPLVLLGLSPPICIRHPPSTATAIPSDIHRLCRQHPSPRLMNPNTPDMTISTTTASTSLLLRHHRRGIFLLGDNTYVCLTYFCL
uniref:Uncharacterized protein n=1 Tax=Opuntia streptacantha TaxID=393608 RepID=A0A7C9AWX2_OPUST